MAAAADEIENRCHPPASPLDAMREAPPFRVLAPHAAIGLETDLITVLSVLETITSIDDSATW